MRRIIKAPRQPPVSILYWRCATSCRLPPEPTWRGVSILYWRCEYGYTPLHVALVMSSFNSLLEMRTGVDTITAKMNNIVFQFSIGDAKSGSRKTAA